MSPGSTVGSVVCTDLRSGRSCEAIDVSHVHFTPIPEATIEKLIAGGFCHGRGGSWVKIHSFRWVQRIYFVRESCS